jgi:hypothetical protein
METIRLELLDKNQVVYVPVNGESEVTEIVIDMSRAYADYPLGKGEIWFRRPDGELYLKETEQNGGVLTAVLTDIDTEISGIANVEAWWVDGSHLKKSPVYRLGIHQSLTAPDAIRAAEEQALSLLARCQELLAAMTDTMSATYEARDMALAARDEAMESAENAAASEESAGSLLETATGYVDAAVAAADAHAQAASASEAAALNSAAIAQKERKDAQTAAQNAAADKTSIGDALENTAASARAAEQYAQMAMSEHNGADAAYQAALGQQELAQEARRDAQKAQTAAETAKDGAVSAMNTAAENSQQAEQARDAARAAQAAAEAARDEIINRQG